MFDEVIVQVLGEAKSISMATCISGGAQVENELLKGKKAGNISVWQKEKNKSVARVGKGVKD